MGYNEFNLFKTRLRTYPINNIPNDQSFDLSHQHFVNTDGELQIITPDTTKKLSVKNITEIGPEKTELLIELSNNNRIFAKPDRVYPNNAPHNCQILIEAETLMNLKHPCIPKYLGIGITGPRDNKEGVLYLLTEYVEGRSLLGIQREELPLTMISSIFEQLGSVVSYMHGKDYFHGDLGKNNILITDDGRVGVIDFGLAGKVSGLSCVRKLPPVGTRGYVAYERFQGLFFKEGDVTSLAIIMFSILNQGADDLEGLISCLWSENTTLQKHHVSSAYSRQIGEQRTSEILKILESAIQKDIYSRPKPQELTSEVCRRLIA